MKYIAIIIAATCLFLVSCSSGEGNWEEDQYWENEMGAYEEGYAPSEMGEAPGPSQSKRKKGNKVMIHQVKNPQTGMVSETVPLPKYWKITPQAWEGPHGSKVENRQGKNYNGMNGPIPTSVDQVLQREVLPQLKSLGYQVDQVIELPGVTQNLRNSWSKMWKAMPSRDTHVAKGIEATFTKNGERALVVVNFFHTASQYGSFSGYYFTGLTAKPRYYEKHKEDVIYALANKQMTPQAIAAHNQKEQTRSNQSWAAHRGRMAANQRNFEASQRAARTNSEVSDIIHEGYMKRSRMQDAGHSKTIDGIRGESPAVNPYTGQQFKVQQGYKFYYMNQNGQVFGTNDAFYNPSNDPNVNNQQWRKVQAPGGY